MEIENTTIAEQAPESAPAEGGLGETELRRALEGLLFITDRPLSAVELSRLVGQRDQEKIVAIVEDLRRELEETPRGYRLIAVAEGWQMATRPELSVYVRKLFSDRATMRLSTAAQETLSIIAYKQPLTRAEIEEIRGVEVIAALETLLEKRLVKVVGRKETVGRPLMYGTTMEFLRHFGLRSLEELPPLDRFSPPAPAPGQVAQAPEAPIVDAEPTAELVVEQTAELGAEAITEAFAETNSDSTVETAVEPETAPQDQGFRADTDE